MYCDNYEAYVLAKVYGLLPPQPCYRARWRNTNTGKFEADKKAGESSRCMLLASYVDKTNVLIKYNPAELENP
jgi:hypothetical protein